jgi:hypothetical protein
MDNETFFFVACFSNDFDCLNGLLYDTINNICHQDHAYVTSNESFTYSQMLREEDHKQFFEAMEVKLADHEFCNHWTLMNARTYLSEQRQSWLSGLLSISGFQMGP